jgi:hypothetical protein
MAVTGAYIWSNLQLDRDKIVRILAIAYGIEKPDSDDDDQSLPPPPEQVSLEEISQARAIHVRHLEMREQALKNAFSQLQFEQQNLAADRTQYDKRKEEFEARLLAMEEEAQSGGVARLTAILEKIKPQQAKEQILQMLADDEMDNVVKVLSGMQDSKRAKLLAEFKTPEESEKLYEILSRIREGVPQSSLASQARQQLQPSQPPGP